MLDLHKEKFKKVEVLFGKIFSILPLTPNHYTLLSIFFGFLTFYFLTKQKIAFAIFSFLVASLLDFIDGAVARFKNLATKKGAYLETICDRYVEGMLLLGMLFLPLPKIFLPPAFWIFLILFGSVMTTYAKAAAKEKELVVQELKGGLLSRAERLILLLIALFLGNFNFYWMENVLILIAILTNFTALQRIFSALKLDGTK